MIRVLVKQLVSLATSLSTWQTEDYNFDKKIHLFFKSFILKSLVLRDWSKGIGGRGGPEQRGVGSSVFEPLVRGGS